MTENPKPPEPFAKIVSYGDEYRRISLVIGGVTVESGPVEKTHEWTKMIVDPVNRAFAKALAEKPK